MDGTSQTKDPTAKTVIVMGGGLAGLSAARCLVDRGYKVKLIEMRPFLGGRAFSFRDREVDVEVDNGQHVFMGCCTYYIDFLRAIGTLDNVYLQDKLRIEVIGDGSHGVLASTKFLGPLHLFPSFLRYPHLGLGDKLLAVYGLIAAKLSNRAANRKRLDEQTFYDWLKAHRQTERAISNLWNLIILPTLNDDIHDVSADMGLMILQEGLLKKPGDAAIGYSRVGLTSLAGEPARRFLESRGSELLMGRAVKSIGIQDGSVLSVELSDGSSLKADAYLSALPFRELLELLPNEVAGSHFFDGASKLTSSPIVGIHLWYDRTIMDQEFLAFLDSPVQWVFNKTLIQGSDGQAGQHVCISISGAWDYVDRPKEELRELFGREMERLFPRARGATIEKSLVVKQPQATFRCTPGAGRNRPPQGTPVSNLFLAGEWTETGWPSTMEGAVRSGVFAAEAVSACI